MLVALNQEEKQVYAKAVIKNHTGEYRCPACHGRVIYRAGPRTIPHFAHQAKESCHADTEAESIEHLSGKTKLYQWIENSHIDVELEKYLSSIKQRPDLFIKIEDRYYAIEYQCSPIHDKLFLKRTLGYLTIGVIPVWIFHSHFIKQKGTYLWRLTSYLKLALRKSSSPYLLFYDPLQSNLIQVIGNLIPTSRELYFGQMDYIYLSSRKSFKTILSPPVQRLSFLNDWFKRRKLQLQNEIRFKGLQSKLINELYQEGVSPYNVPEFIGIPLLSACTFEVSALCWQGFVYIDLLKSFKQYGSIHVGWIRARFLERIKNRDIILNHSPLLEQNLFTALDDYLKFLEKIDYLGKNNASHYIIREDFTFTNLEEVIKSRLFDF